MRDYNTSKPGILRRLYISLLLGMVAGLPLICRGGPADAKRLNTRVRVQQLRSQQKQKHEKALEAQKKLRVIKQQQETVTGRLERVQRELDRASQELSTTSHKLGSTQSKLKQNETSMREVQQRYNQHLDALTDRLTSIYKSGSLGYLEVLVNSRSLSDLVNRAYYFRLIVEYDANLLQQIGSEQDEIKHRHRELDQQQQDLRQLQTLAAVKKARVKAQKQQEGDELARIRQDRATYEQFVREEEAASRQIEQLILRLTSTPSSPGAYHVTPWKGGLMRPIAGPITSGFGWRIHPIFHVKRFHTGVDIGAPYGAIVHAAAAGVVVFAGWQPAYGHAVIIDHGGGLTTMYGHCSAVLVSPGTHVSAGTPVARVGNTGLSTGPHLHFEVRRNGKPVPPM